MTALTLVKNIVPLTFLVCFVACSILAGNEFCYRRISRNAWTRYAIVMIAALAWTASLFALAFGRYVAITIQFLTFVLAVTPCTHFIVHLSTRSKMISHS